MLTEVLAAILGAVAAALITHLLSRRDRSGDESRLEGRSLIEMADYPVHVRDDGMLTIDRDAVRRVGDLLLQEYNPRAAIDLLYLAEHNPGAIGPAERATLDRVRRRYRRRLRRLVEPEAIATQREHLLKQFCAIAEGLGDTFAGVPIEFVLHDIRDPLHSIRLIKNSITGRAEGDQASSFGEDVIRAFGQLRWTGTKYSYRLRDPRSRREIKATTIPLEDHRLGLVAFLCVNIDIARLSPDSPELAALAEQLVATPGGWGHSVFDVKQSASA